VVAIALFAANAALNKPRERPTPIGRGQRTRSFVQFGFKYVPHRSCGSLLRRGTYLNPEEFRFNPATDSDLMPAGVPI